MGDPWTDCPTCPKCGSPCGIPIRESLGRFYGPEDSTVWCCACGTGWAATDTELSQAEKAQAAWEAHDG